MHFRSTIIGCSLGCWLLGCGASGPKPASPPALRVAPSGGQGSTAVQPFVWPHGTRAAVSLTYDDALKSQVDNAVPALARRGLRATFFLSGASPFLQASPDAFRGLVAAGHELGSHTMNHPCDRAQSWVRPGFALQDYDAARMQAELSENIQQLRNFGQQGPFSFAYPCGSTWLGEDHTSYVALVQAAFGAARGVAPAVVDPTNTTLFEVPSPPGNTAAAQLIDWVDRALAVSGWVVFTFHGVAGDYLDVKQADHEALLDYLAQHKNSVWTERFGKVASYIRAQVPH